MSRKCRKLNEMSKRQRDRAKYGISLLIEGGTDHTLIPELIMKRLRISRASAVEMLQEQLRVQKERAARRQQIKSGTSSYADSAGNDYTAEEMANVHSIIGNMCLFDDFFFQAVLKDNKRAAEELLRPIMNDPDLTVDRISVQETLPGLGAERGVVIDLEVVTGTGDIAAVEIQRSMEGAIPERPRFIHAKEDTAQLRRGQNYKELRDVYVIVMLEGDPYGDGKPAYHVKKTIEENGKEYIDGSHTIFTNGMYSADDPMGRLMHDMRATNPDDIYNVALRETSSRFKKTGQEGESELGSQATAEFDALIGRIVKRRYKKEFDGMEQKLERSEANLKRSEADLKRSEADLKRSEAERKRIEAERDRDRNEIAELKKLLAELKDVQEGSLSDETGTITVSTAN